MKVPDDQLRKLLGITVERVDAALRAAQEKRAEKKG
jgi:hypothetical protein